MPAMLGIERAEADTGRGVAPTGSARRWIAAAQGGAGPGFMLAPQDDQHPFVGDQGVQPIAGLREHRGIADRDAQELFGARRPAERPEPGSRAPRHDDRDQFAGHILTSGPSAIRAGGYPRSKRLEAASTILILPRTRPSEESPTSKEKAKRLEAASTILILPCTRPSEESPTSKRNKAAGSRFRHLDPPPYAPQRGISNIKEK